MLEGLTRYRISHPTLVLIPSSSNNGRYEGAQVIPEGAVEFGILALFDDQIEPALELEGGALKRET